MPERKALSSNLKKIRTKQHESQFDFAENCGISVDSLSLIEREKYNPSLELLQKIAAYTGYTVSELLDTNTEK